LEVPVLFRGLFEVVMNLPSTAVATLRRNIRYVIAHGAMTSQPVLFHNPAALLVRRYGNRRLLGRIVVEVRIDLFSPTCTAHVGPGLAVEAWRVLQRLLIHIEEECLLVRTD